MDERSIGVFIFCLMCLSGSANGINRHSLGIQFLESLFEHYEKKLLAVSAPRITGSRAINRIANTSARLQITRLAKRTANTIHMDNSLVIVWGAALGEMFIAHDSPLAECRS